MFLKASLDPARQTREQLSNLAATLDRRSPEPRPMSTYEPLVWLLRTDVGNQTVHGARRSLYLKLVQDLAREFDGVYTERLLASNGQWDFSDVYLPSELARKCRKCIRRMRWCAFQHLLGLPSAGNGSVKAYQALMQLLSDDTSLVRAPDLHR
jgi:hypothetical protein